MGEIKSAHERRRGGMQGGREGEREWERDEKKRTSERERERDCKGGEEGGQRELHKCIYTYVQMYVYCGQRATRTIHTECKQLEWTKDVCVYWFILSTPQCVAVCCSVWQCVAVCGSVWQCAAECCSVLQCAAVCCNVLQCVWIYTIHTGHNQITPTLRQKDQPKHRLWNTVHCNTLHCNTLQHTQQTDQHQHRLAPFYRLNIGSLFSRESAQYFSFVGT